MLKLELDHTKIEHAQASIRCDFRDSMGQALMEFDRLRSKVKQAVEKLEKCKGALIDAELELGTHDAMMVHLMHDGLMIKQLQRRITEVWLCIEHGEVDRADWIDLMFGLPGESGDANEQTHIFWQLWHNADGSILDSDGNVACTPGDCEDEIMGEQSLLASTNTKPGKVPKRKLDFDAASGSDSHKKKQSEAKNDDECSSSSSAAAASSSSSILEPMPEPSLREPTWQPQDAEAYQYTCDEAVSASHDTLYGFRDLQEKHDFHEEAEKLIKSSFHRHHMALDAMNSIAFHDEQSYDDNLESLYELANEASNMVDQWWNTWKGNKAKQKISDDLITLWSMRYAFKAHNRKKILESFALNLSD